MTDLIHPAIEADLEREGYEIEDIVRWIMEEPPVELPRRVRGIGTGMPWRPTSGLGREE